ncbi:MAG: 50S ribosomal protein L18 [Patescibacteria group bacterium]
MSVRTPPARIRRHRRVRARISGTADRPRLAVFRSHAHIEAQLIDDVAGHTLVSATDRPLNAKATKTERAAAVGTELAAKARTQKITTVVFDRGGYQYHGRVKALAEAARAGGLIF